MSIEIMKRDHVLLLECISGSKAYGLDTPQSDTDIKGVFSVSKQLFYSLAAVDQINDETNDKVYYELNKFFELLAKNNPNIIELLATPKPSVLFRHSFMERLKPELFLSKLCKNSFAGYAMMQVKKARGLNKKMLNPIDQQRKTVQEFCYVSYVKGSLPLSKFLEIKQIESNHCGLVKINHMRDIYYLYSDKNAGYKGISSGNSNEVCLSQVEKAAVPVGIMYFNREGYSSYCKDYKEYWNWVEKRNDVRYQGTLEHGKNYDAKNMMHTFRLLNMAEEIAIEGKVNVYRKDREALLKIKSGFYEYEDLLKMAEEKVLKVNEAFDSSTLPELPNMDTINNLLVELREELFK